MSHQGQTKPRWSCRQANRIAVSSLGRTAVIPGRHSRRLGNSSECVSDFHAPDYGSSSLTSTDAAPHRRGSRQQQNRLMVLGSALEPWPPERRSSHPAFHVSRSPSHPRETLTSRKRLGRPQYRQAIRQRQNKQCKHTGVTLLRVNLTLPP